VPRVHASEPLMLRPPSFEAVAVLVGWGGHV
jgi:hypothetical protein